MDESRPRRRQPVPLGVPGGQGLRPEPRDAGDVPPWAPAVAGHTRLQGEPVQPRVPGAAAAPSGTVRLAGEGRQVGEPTTGHDPREPTAAPAPLAREHGGQAGIAGLAAQRDQGEELAGGRIDCEGQPLAARAPTVRARPAPPRRVGPAPGGQLVAVPCGPATPCAARYFGEVRSLDRPADGLSREGGQAAAHRRGGQGPFGRSPQKCCGRRGGSG